MVIVQYVHHQLFAEIAKIRTGYVFGGWFSKVSGGGTEFSTSTVVSADITVYARWDYTVTYNGNGSILVEFYSFLAISFLWVFQCLFVD